MPLHDDLIAAGLPVNGTAVEGQTVLWTRSLTAQEDALSDSIINPVVYRQAQARIEAADIPNWATWTLAQFETWCNANLMTDAQIDGLTLSANLKTNLKANNAFTRNAGKMLITLRNYTRIIE